jgi:hypothetical protein
MAGGTTMRICKGVQSKSSLVLTLLLLQFIGIAGGDCLLRRLLLNLRPETQDEGSIDLQGATGLKPETQDEGFDDLQDVVMEDTQKDKAVLKGGSKRITYLQLSKLANELVACATKVTSTLRNKSLVVLLKRSFLGLVPNLCSWHSSISHV